MTLNITTKYAKGFIDKDAIAKLQPYAEYCHKSLIEKTGKGNDFLGWLDLPEKMLKDEVLFETLSKIKNKWQQLKITHIVVIGIGGSYLGTKAIYEALCPNLSEEQFKLVFAGHHIDSLGFNAIINELKDENFAIVVISKSGTTLEPALAFRSLLQLMKLQFGDDKISDRIIAITDEKKGALKKLADRNNWQTFVIADDVGGRYSVLSPVGIVPLFLMGFDVLSLLRGAKEMQTLLCTQYKYDENPALQYAVLRYTLYNSGKPIEILTSFHPHLQYLIEWWKQLFGESEGKQGRGVFPSGVVYSTDLHSMGQYVQDGLRIIFETFITTQFSAEDIVVPHNIENDDELNYLAGAKLSDIQKQAEKGTILAHYEGGVPIIELNIETIDEYNIGQLVYFFEFACAISGYLLEVNPFDQPGVEAYKLNMFALLHKPGMEAETKQINEKIKQYEQL